MESVASSSPTQLPNLVVKFFSFFLFFLLLSVYVHRYKVGLFISKFEKSLFYFREHSPRK